MVSLPFLIYYINLHSPYQKDLQNIQDASDDLMLMDDEELVPYLEFNNDYCYDASLYLCV